MGIHSNPDHVMAYTDGEVLWVDPADLDHVDVHPPIRLRIEHGLADRSEPLYT